MVEPILRYLGKLRGYFISGTFIPDKIIFPRVPEGNVVVMKFRPEKKNLIALAILQ